MNHTDNAPDNARDIHTRPLDHATARIVTEIAAAVLGPLREDIKKTVCEAMELKIQSAAKEPQDAPVAPPKTPEEPDKTEKSPDLQNLQKLLHTINGDIKTWEGILKAEGVAQTKELSELSSEISDLVKDIKSSLLSAISETAHVASEKDSERGARLLKLTEDGMGAVEKRLLRLEIIAFVSGVALALLLVFAIAAAIK
ncbi:hypothetical protein AGMMS49957_01030 [Synergistales bacterium]|nr:hypothetical protein AGMMS49957_01030 [Synergistales bacterium]